MKALNNEQRKERIEAICNHIEEGNTLRAALLKYDTSARSFYDWIDDNEAFKQRYTRAKDLGCQMRFDTIKDLVSPKESDIYTDANGIKRTNHKTIARDRLRFDAERWQLSKELPKKYGDKLDLTTAGDKINAPILNVDPLSKDN